MENKLTTYVNNAEIDSSLVGITIEQDGTGDSALNWLLTGIQRWTMGIDNSDSDKLKISSAGSIDTTTRLTIDTTGNVGIGTTVPTHKLNVIGDANITGSLYVLNQNVTHSHLLKQGAFRRLSLCYQT